MTANLKWSDFEHYLKGEHLNGRKVIATIAEIVIEETHAQAGRTEEKPVCLFPRKQERTHLVPDQHPHARRHVRRRCHRLYPQAPLQLEAIPLHVAGRDTLPECGSSHTAAGDDAVGRPTTAADRGGCTDRDHPGGPPSTDGDAAGNACCRHLIFRQSRTRALHRGLCQTIIRPS